MRLIWNLDGGVHLEAIDRLVTEFYKKYQRKPDVIRLDVDSSRTLYSVLFKRPIAILEVGKEYANYISTPVGIVRLDLIDSSEEYAFAVAVAELDIDKEFEKIVLNEEES